MKRIKRVLNAIVPSRSVIPLLVAAAFNLSVYGVARLIAGGWPHHNIEGKLDQMIPFVPATVGIYLGCYLFWIANYILIGRQGKKEVCQFFAGDFLSRIVCFAFYLIYPTTNTRPVVEAQGFWNQVVAALYAVDAADNLFPSIHCLVSWFCYIGLRGRKEISAWYRAASCVFALMVCVSTLTTKQHVIPDVIGGIFLAEICFYIGKKPKVWETYERILNKVNGFFHLEGEDASCGQKRK